MIEIFSRDAGLAAPLRHWMAAPHENGESDAGEAGGIDDNDDSDDIDEELDETGEVTNRSSGKSGTDTSAEPERKPT